MVQFSFFLGKLIVGGAGVILGLKIHVWGALNVFNNFGFQIKFCVSKGSLVLRVSGSIRAAFSGRMLESAPELDYLISDRKGPKLNHFVNVELYANLAVNHPSKRLIPGKSEEIRMADDAGITGTFSCFQ